MKKRQMKNFCIVFLLFISFLLPTSYVFAQEDENNVSSENVSSENALSEGETLSEKSADSSNEADSSDSLSEFDDFEDFDDLFSDAQDEEVAESKSAPAPEKSQQVISFSGALESDLGVGFISNNEDYFTPGAAFSLSNYFYMTARANDVFNLKATLYTVLPTFQLNLKELYFNYLICDTVYLQAGKRAITWGNLELLTNNILADSASCTSASIAFTIWKFDFSGVAMYNYNWDKSYKPTKENLAVAASFGGAFGFFQFNAFGRRWATADPNRLPLGLGLETKISIKGYDLYNQTVVNAHYYIHNPENNYINKIVCTSGFMKDWDDPRIGVIVEYRYIYYDETDYPKAEKNNHRIYAKFGISRLFKNTSKFGVSAWHDITAHKGYISPGYIYTALPSADIEVGLPITYTSDTWEVTPAVNLAISWSY